LRANNKIHNIVAIITQTIVDPDDPAFKHPTKPIGPFYTLEQAGVLRQQRNWKMIEDSQRGYRRVVPSPMPVQIQEARIIRNMLDNGEIVIAVGGGGIPVVRQPDRSLKGVEAVIDKDLATSRLALDIEADVILCLTAVEKVYRDYGKSTSKPLDRLTVCEAMQMMEQGQFGAGSMEPKIRAAVEFLGDVRTPDSGQPAPEKEFIISSLDKAVEALHGRDGTRITR
jgi:carbamate kinase